MLHLSFTQLGGTLPTAWAQAQVLPAILEIHVSNTHLSGVLPDEWAGGVSWPHLQARLPAELPGLHARLGWLSSIYRNSSSSSSRCSSCSSWASGGSAEST